MWSAELTSPVTELVHYGVTIGEQNAQNVTRSRKKAMKYARTLLALQNSCPRESRALCTEQQCQHTENYCFCGDPLDTGCSQAVVRRRLRMETPSQQRLVIPNTDALEYSVVVPNILPRTPYYVRVGAMNEMGLGLYRVTPTPVAALVIAEKPINVVLMLINSTHDALQNSVEVSRPRRVFGPSSV